MSVYTEQGHWRCRFQINGKRHFVNLPHCKTKTEARHAEAEAKAKALRGELNTPAEKTTFAEFFKGEFLPWSESNHSPAWHSSVRKYYGPTLLAFFGNFTFSELSPLLVEKFKAERRKSTTKHGQARKPASINRELAILSGIFKLACKAGLLSSNPASQVSGLIENNERERVLEPEEEERLFTVLRERHNIVDSYLLPLVTLALHTGIRKGELRLLRKAEVNLTAGEIVRQKSKNGRRRKIKLNAVAKATLAEVLVTKTDSEFVFVNPETGQPFTDWKKGWQSVLKAAKITGLCWHDLRATCATRMMEAHIPQTVVARVLGHRNTKTTDRYERAREQQQQAAVESIAAWAERKRA